jgi:hypothetical protein
MLLILPANFFDSGPPLCLSVILFHRTCPGCGMTRACMHLAHFDYASAFRYNKLVFIVFPALLFLWAMEVIRTGKKLFASKRSKNSPVG